MTSIRSYRELKQLGLFEDRFRYLSLKGSVGRSTFGFDRYLNQRFYTSREWKGVRNEVIVRDNGCDLGVDGMDIYDRILVHHMNPIVVDDFKLVEDYILDPDNLITTTHRTHNAIHFGAESLPSKSFSPRRGGDTKLW